MLGQESGASPRCATRFFSFNRGSVEPACLIPCARLPNSEFAF
jgi:hypothetical protein